MISAIGRRLAVNILLLPLCAAAQPTAKLPAVSVQFSTPTFSRVVALAAPSIVSISAERNGGQSQDNVLRRFFGGDSENAPVPPGPSLGSGVIVSSDGYIITNDHVVDSADDIKVTLSNGAELPGTIVGKDPKTDIAVIKVRANGLVPAVFADSSKTSIGDVVLALGNPFGIGQTVTMGIISATGRGNIGLEDYEDFLQTDAAINPGNSGGALANVNGQVVGINTAILSRTGGNQGIGFAVPSNLARQVMVSLIATGRVARAYLGVTVQDINEALARKFGVSPRGALVSDVARGGPASEAGVRPGDVIVAFDGHPVSDSRALRLQAAATPPNRSVALDLRRGSRAIVARASLGEAGDRAAAGAAGAGRPKALAGAILEDMTPEHHSKLEIPVEVRGALVTAIERGSPAYESGLRPGDVVEEVDRHPVVSARDAWTAAAGTPGSDVLLRVWESGTSHYLLIKRGG